MSNPWARYDAWEARDRTLLEAAAIRARRLGYPEDPAGERAPEPAAVHPDQLALVLPARYRSPSPDQEPERAPRPLPR